MGIGEEVRMNKKEKGRKIKEEEDEEEEYEGKRRGEITSV